MPRQEDWGSGGGKLVPSERTAVRIRSSLTITTWVRWAGLKLRGEPGLAVALVGGVVARVVFWAVTDRQWEDGLITITHARNAAMGLGLTHHVGEGPVHGFTSALSVLVPLLGESVQLGSGIVVLRLASVVSVAISIVYAHRISGRLGLGPWPTFFVLAYLAFDQNQIFYGIAGMETQIAVAVLLAGTFHVMRGDPTKAGIALGLAVLARPDFLIWVGIVFIYLILQARHVVARAGLVAAAIVAPWLVFTFAYYGSPIPHTIQAKSIAYMPEVTSFGGWMEWGQSQLLGHLQTIWRFFAPFLGDTGVTSAPLPQILLFILALSMIGLALLGSWSTHRVQGWWPAIAYVAAFMVFRILFLRPLYFDWYMPPFMAIVVFLAASGIQRVGRFLPTSSSVLSASLAALFAIHLPFTVPLEARIQHDIEDRVRKPLGEHLDRVVPSNESVGSESAGYVGYYGNVLLYDSPGLTSPTSLTAMKKLPDAVQWDPVALFIELTPDWLVLRPPELERMRQTSPSTAASYRVVREFAIAGPVSTTQWGLSKNNGDGIFYLLRHID